MARGWESKSVESQQADLKPRAEKQQAQAGGLDPARLELIRKKETLILSRKRVMRDLENAQNPRYREMLSHALAALDAELTALGTPRPAGAATA